MSEEAFRRREMDRACVDILAAQLRNCKRREEEGFLSDSMKQACRQTREETVNVSRFYKEPREESVDVNGFLNARSCE